MQVTRRYWTFAATGVALAVLAAVFARPVLLYGGAGIAALLLARQYWFLRALERADDELAVEQTLPSRYVKQNDEMPVTLAARLETPATLDLTVSLRPPLLARVSDETATRLDVAAGDLDAKTTVSLTWSVVGRASFDPAAVTATDPFGLFRETLSRGTAPAVTVEPRVPRNVQVGAGGDQTVTSFGGHRSDQFGSGTDPATVREYVPGDSVSDIDWKATARQQYPHVREYEVETDRQVVLVVDHRNALTAGPTGETKLDYLQTVALTMADSATEFNDPLGLATVGEDGTTSWEAPDTSPETYDAVEARLHELVSDARTMQDQGSTTTSGRRLHSHTPATAQRKAVLLADEDTAYGRTVRPFLESSERYLQRMDGDPLFGTVRTRLTEISDSVWTLLFTDDTDRTQLRQTVKLARQQSTHVVVFLAPDVLFDRDGLADLDDRYQSYVGFEDFRRELAGLQDVTAFEVGPGDRIDAVLDAGRRRRQ